MRRRAGRNAIGLPITASALGGLVGGLVLLFFSPLLAAFALRFGPPEYAAMALLGLLTIAIVSEGSTVTGLITGAFGLAIATMGTDEFTNAYRFTFGNFNLTSGPHIVPVVVGLIALSEVIFQIENGNLLESPRIQRLRISFRALRLIMAHKLNLIRSALIGSVMGAIPGAGGDVSAFVSCAVARRAARPGDGYGEGAEGGVFFAYLVGNVVLLIAGIVLVPSFGRVLKLPKAWILPAVLLLSTMGDVTGPDQPLTTILRRRGAVRHCWFSLRERGASLSELTPCWSLLTFMSSVRSRSGAQSRPSEKDTELIASLRFLSVAVTLYLATRDYAVVMRGGRVGICQLPAGRFRGFLCKTAWQKPM